MSQSNKIKYLYITLGASALALIILIIKKIHEHKTTNKANENNQNQEKKYITLEKNRNLVKMTEKKTTDQTNVTPQKQNEESILKQKSKNLNQEPKKSILKTNETNKDNEKKKKKIQFNSEVELMNAIHFENDHKEIEYQKIDEEKTTQVYVYNGGLLENKSSFTTPAIWNPKENKFSTESFSMIEPNRDDFKVKNLLEIYTKSKDIKKKNNKQATIITNYLSRKGRSSGTHLKMKKLPILIRDDTENKLDPQHYNLIVSNIYSQNSEVLKEINKKFSFVDDEYIEATENIRNFFDEKIGHFYQKLENNMLNIESKIETNTFSNKEFSQNFKDLFMDSSLRDFSPNSKKQNKYIKNIEQRIMNIAATHMNLSEQYSNKLNIGLINKNKDEFEQKFKQKFEEKYESIAQNFLDSIASIMYFPQENEQNKDFIEKIKVFISNEKIITNIQNNIIITNNNPHTIKYITGLDSSEYANKLDEIEKMINEKEYKIDNKEKFKKINNDKILLNNENIDILISQQKEFIKEIEAKIPDEIDLSGNHFNFERFIEKQQTKMENQR